jgi:hypothetical protein
MHGSKNYAALADPCVAHPHNIQLQIYAYPGTGVPPAGFSAREIGSTFGERKRDAWDIGV